MSIVVMGMEMPIMGWICELNNNGECRREHISCGKYIPQMCPLRPLPEKHGDLVDISQEVNIEYFDDMNQEWSLKAGTVADALSVCEEFPVTIVEAEG